MIATLTHESDFAWVRIFKLLIEQSTPRMANQVQQNFTTCSGLNTDHKSFEPF